MRTQNSDLKAQIDLTNAYSELCPTDYDRARIREMIANMRKGRSSHRLVCKAITAAIYDGLAYGNWPSALRDMANDQKS